MITVLKYSKIKIRVKIQLDRRQGRVYQDSVTAFCNRFHNEIPYPESPHRTGIDKQLSPHPIPKIAARLPRKVISRSLDQAAVR